MNKKKYHNGLSVVMDLGLSQHYAQVLTIPVKTSSNMLHRNKERNFREDKACEFLYLINQVTWQKVSVESDVNAKFDVFSGCLFYHYDTTFSAKTVYLRESGKFGSLSELKTPVKRSLFLNNNKKNGPANTRFRIY